MLARLGAEVIKVERLGGEETPKTSDISVAPRDSEPHPAVGEHNEEVLGGLPGYPPRSPVCMPRTWLITRITMTQSPRNQL